MALALLVMASAGAAGLPATEQAAASMAPQVAHEQVPEFPGAGQNIVASVHERLVADPAPHQSMEDMIEWELEQAGLEPFSECPSHSFCGGSAQHN